jgi:hypothetical protein
MTTPIAGLPEISENQANKAVTHNQALRQIEINFGAVVSRSLTAPPGSPADGAVYIPATGATGAWSGQSNKIVQWSNGGWNFYAPFQYQQIYSIADSAELQYIGTEWIEATIGSASSITGNPNNDTFYGKESGNKGFFDFFPKVRATILTGLTTGTNTVIAATDSLLVALQNLQAQLLTTAKLATVNNFTIQQRFPLAALTDGATINWNLNTQQVASVTLAGNRTLAAPTNIQAGGTYILFVRQDGTGNRTLTLDSAYRFSATPTLSTAANAIDIFSFVSDGTSLFGSVSKGYL